MDTVFFVASKLIGALLRPDTWIVIALACIVLALILQRRRTSLWISIERRYPANPSLDAVDGIIVLGGGEDARASAYWGQVQLKEGAERFTTATELARRFPEAQVLFTGGSGALRDVAGAVTSEASIAERFFLAQGIVPERLLLESQSRNTAENARLSLTLADPGPIETWILVTSAFQMPRAMRSFDAAGWDGLVAWPVDYRTSGFGDGIGWDLIHNLSILRTAIREHAGQIAYRLTGR